MLWTLLFTEGEVGQGHKKGHMFTVNVVTECVTCTARPMPIMEGTRDPKMMD